MKLKNISNVLDIVFICDMQTLPQTVVALRSLYSRKLTDSHYRVFIVAVELSEDILKKLQNLAKPSFDVEIISVESSNYSKYLDKKISGLTLRALCKFDLPQILNGLDKVLYLDSDILVCKDLHHLLHLNIENKYAAVVKEPILSYGQNENNLNKNQYFNAGVLLLNLALLRKNAIFEKCLNKKIDPFHHQSRDQEIFNKFFQGNVLFLEIIYNFLYLTFLENAQRFGIKEINEHYDIKYNTLDVIKDAAHIIHFTPKYKPWEYVNMVYAKEWKKYYIQTFLVREHGNIQLKHFDGEHPLRARSFWEKLKKRFL